MVDAQYAAVAHEPADAGDGVGVAALPDPLGMQRGVAPVLALGVERVGWRPGRRHGQERPPLPPDVVAAWVDAQWQVEQQPGAPRSTGSLKLALGDPLDVPVVVAGGRRRLPGRQPARPRLAGPFLPWRPEGVAGSPERCIVLEGRMAGGEALQLVAAGTRAGKLALRRGPKDAALGGGNPPVVDQRRPARVLQQARLLGEGRTGPGGHL